MLQGSVFISVFSFVSEVNPQLIIYLLSPMGSQCTPVDGQHGQYIKKKHTQVKLFLPTKCQIKITADFLKRDKTEVLPEGTKHRYYFDQT